MNDRSQLIDKLQSSRDSREAYIRAKVSVLVSAQLHALRLRRGWTQAQFAHEADMRQSRVSAMEQPGSVNFNLETLVRSAAAHSVGLAVKFVPFSEMLRWENAFNQDAFNPAPLSQDRAFLSGAAPYQWVFSYQPIAPPVGSAVLYGDNSQLGQLYTANAEVTIHA